METYIGTKQVLAEPMDELTAVEKGYAYTNEDNHEWRNGYHVQYKNPDGSTYDSWLPNNVFEDAYKCAGTYLDRLAIEQEELHGSIDKLINFIKSDKSKGVNKQRLYEQLRCMQDYEFAILKRLSV